MNLRSNLQKIKPEAWAAFLTLAALVIFEFVHSCEFDKSLNATKEQLGLTRESNIQTKKNIDESKIFDDSILNMIHENNQKQQEFNTNQLKEQTEHDRLSLMPVIDFRQMVGANSDPVIAMRNSGEGAALVQNIIYYYNGKRYNSPFKLLDSAYSTEVTFLKPGKPIVKAYDMVDVYAPLQKGSENELIGFRYVDISNMDACEKFLNDIGIVVVFKDVFGKTYFQGFHTDKISDLH